MKPFGEFAETDCQATDYSDNNALSDSDYVRNFPISGDSAGDPVE